MKKLILVFFICALLAAPAMANPSLYFSTIAGGGDSWTITESGGFYTLTFASLEVDTSSPTPDAVLLDIVNLPDMDITNIVDNGSFITALLVPKTGQSLTITRDTAGSPSVVMTADVGQGGTLVAGSSYLAYQSIQDDLDISSYSSGYSNVIDQFVTIDISTTPSGLVDLSFSGHTTQGNIYAFLGGGTGSIGGNMGGRINALLIPAPGAVLLLDPNGGEVLTAGSTYTINWSSTGPISEVVIEYSINNGTDWSDVNTVPNTGLYNWLVPAVSSNQCLIRISDSTNPDVNDISDGVFTIETYVFVPNVVGLTQSQVESEIIAAGLVVGSIDEQYSDTVAAGNVISQDPVGGTSVPIGSAVNLVVSLGHQAITIYVDNDATGANDGSSWSDAFTELQSALDVAMAGDEIWVAAGVYYPSSDYGLGIGDRGKHFRMINNVAIYGGFPVGGDTFANRDPNQYETILSGDLNGDDGPNFANNSENCYHIFYHPDGTNLDPNAILDGFVITAGNANGSGDHYDGAGMRNNKSSPTVNNCTFSDNSSDGWGTMCCIGGGGLMMSGCTFSENLASMGGGIFLRDHNNAIITDCIFIRNTVIDAGGGICTESAKGLKLLNCMFTENSTESTYEWGGGGGIYNMDCADHTVANCSFIANSSHSNGGGIWHFGRRLTMQNCTFSGNVTDGQGGGMYEYCSFFASIANCTFTGNQASSGGAISTYSLIQESLTNCTFAHNLAESYGGAIYGKSADALWLTNCILWGNTAGSDGNEISLHLSSTWDVVDVNYCDVQGGQGGIYNDGSGTVNWGSGNIDADPCFADPDSNDYHLLPNSPCIDAGDNSAVPIDIVTDLDGNPRIVGATVDMGAYEYQEIRRPDLEVTSEDIIFGAYPAVPGEPNSISATVWNRGNIPALSIGVSFSDSSGPIGSNTIPILDPNQSATVSIQYSWPDTGYQLITVAVDPANDINELDETNNSASKLYQIGYPEDMDANVAVESNPPRTWPEGSIATIRGDVFYRIKMTGYTDLEYPLKGGSVTALITHDSYPSEEKQLSGLYTDAQGQFSFSFPVPGVAGDDFNVAITVTDGNFIGTWEDEFHVKDYIDLWLNPEDINVSNFNPASGEVIDINTTVHARTDNTQPALNVPVTLNAYPPAAGSQIDYQVIPRIGKGDSNTVSSNWSSSTEGTYCIEAILGPGYSDDDNGNNRAMRPVMVGPLPNSIDVVIETPPEGADVNASQTTTVNVSVTDDNGNAIIPCALETLSLQFTGEEQRSVNLKDYFDWDTEKYVYQWRPGVDTNGPVCLEATAQTVEILGSLTNSNQTCVDVIDDVSPTFRIYAYPYYARIGQTVRFYVYSSELLLNDQLDSIDVNDSNGQPIDFTFVAHPSGTRWIYETNELPEETAWGTTTIDVNGTDIHGNMGSKQGYFVVVDVVPDLWVHSEDINFSDINPDLGEMITVEALVHASSSNTNAVNDVPVTFSAHHIAGDYDIGEKYIAQILPNTYEPVDINWTNAAEGVYIIEVELGPGFPDNNGGNNNATRAILVGDIPFVAVFDVTERSRIGRTTFRYKCWVILDNLSPLAIENVQLELIDVPDNIDINDPCVSYVYIDAWGTATSEDSSDYCIIDVNRVEPIEPAEIIWQITYEIADTGQTSQQMSSTIVLLEPEGLAGNFTGESIVDFEDVAILAEQWLQAPGVPSADVAPWPGGDGIVNFRDFAVVAENWLK